MSIIFQVNGNSIWNPSNLNANLFLSFTRSVESYLQVQSGFSDIQSDEISIDTLKLRKFITKYQNQEHQVFLNLTEGYFGVLCVICHRVGIFQEINNAKVDTVSRSMPL